MFRSSILLFALLLLWSTRLCAVPARPTPMRSIQPDGSVVWIRMQGDERFHYVQTLDGHVLENDAEGYWTYAQMDQDGNLIASDLRLSRAREFSKEDLKHAVTTKSLGMLRRKQGLFPKSVSGKQRKNFKAHPSRGAIRSLVILVNFSDKFFTTAAPKQVFERMLNEKAYAANGATGSVRDYFRDASMGAFLPEFDVFGPYTLPKNRAFYGKNVDGADANPEQMVVDACNLAFSNGVNFSNYDGNGDAFVDNVFVIYAGENEADGGASDAIWPHKSELSSESHYAGLSVYDYACSSELMMKNETAEWTLCGIGTFVHEFGHVLGLPDFYSTDINTIHHTLSYWSVMDLGYSLNNTHTPPSYSAYERFYLNWIAPLTIDNAATFVLDTLTTTNTTYLISRSGKHNMDGRDPKPEQFFLLENRQARAWDRFLPGHGMLLTRIHYNEKDWSDNTVNNNPLSMGVDLLEADGKASNRNLSGDPFPGMRGITSCSLKLRDGTPIQKTLGDIEERAGKIYFSFKPQKRPEALPARDVTAYSFTASWTSSSDVSGFYLSVYRIPASSDTVFVLKDLPLRDTLFFVSDLSEKQLYAYKVKAFWRDKSQDTETVSEYSNEIKVKLPDLPPLVDKKLWSIRNTDGSVTCYIPFTNIPLYIYDLNGQLIREIHTKNNVIRIDDLPRNRIYILKSGDRRTKLAFY